MSIWNYLKDDLTEKLPSSYFRNKAAGIDQEGRDRAIALARELLLVGKEGEQDVDLIKKYLQVLIDDGLPANKQPKKVLIVGAGIAGLVAGSLLKQAGHEVTIIEANADRIGGRIKTFHNNPFNPEGAAPFSDPRQYAEAGAMRLPDFHPMVLALIDKLNLKRQLFYNVSVDPKTAKTSGHAPPVIYKPFDHSGEWKYGKENPKWKVPTKVNNTWIKTNNQQVRKYEYGTGKAKVEKINKGFEITGPDVNKTTSQLLDEALNPVRARYKDLLDADENPKPGKIGDWVEAWASIIYDFDGLSMYGFLKKFAKKESGKPFTDNEIEAMGTLENLTSRLMLSFMHSFLGRADINPSVTYYEIEGGSWLLPYAFLPELYNNIVMNRRMTHIEYYDEARNQEQNYSPRFTKNEPGERVSVRAISETKTGEGNYDYVEEVFKADVCIITIPFSALRHVSVAPMFSYKKRRAIIELHYDAATKVLLEFSHRWWEFSRTGEWKAALKEVKAKLIEELGETEGKKAYAEKERLWKERDPRTQEDLEEIILSNYVGGGNTTDNPNRFAYVPSHPIPGSKGGVMLSSYSWSDDARRWDSMAENERYTAALKGIVDMHGWQAAMFFTGAGKTQSWMRSPYAYGEAAVFTPGQMSAFHLDIPTNEGPVYFSGEHVSLKHAWIEGCLEMSTRVALQINELEQ